MKTRIKRFILSLILSEPQRKEIMSALWFSHHTYVRRSNHIEAGKVLVAMNDLKPLLNVSKKHLQETESGKRATDDGVVYDNGID